jgi:hypothetical protein
MSLILSSLPPTLPGGRPTLRVQCACGRIYATTVAKAQARGARRCMACRPPAGRALSRGGRRSRAVYRRAYYARTGR